MKRASSLAYRNAYLGVVAFKVVCTIVSTALNAKINADNRAFVFDRTKDITDCRIESGVSWIFDVINWVHYGFRIADLLLTSAVFTFALSSQNEAKKSEVTSFNEKFGAHAFGPKRGSADSGGFGASKQPGASA